MTTPGPVLFARYAYPPNALGYCGPADTRALLEYADARVSDGGLVDLARRFDGAWPYLTLIAAGARRTDPLDPAVVEAYWLGNRLLEQIPACLLIRNLEDRFRHQLGTNGFSDVALMAAAGGRAHHNFHVFAVYPWVGMLRAGHTMEPLHVLDSCRVRWGQVETLENDAAVIRSRPLQWTEGALTLGPARPERVRLRLDGYGLAPRVEPGQWVSAHWDWLCDALDTRQLTSLATYTQNQLDLVNSALIGPAALLG